MVFSLTLVSHMVRDSPHYMHVQPLHHTAGVSAMLQQVAVLVSGNKQVMA